MAGFRTQNGGAHDDCRRCGCNDVSVVEERRRFGQPSQRLHCNHCQLTWWEHPPSWEKPDDGPTAAEIAEADQYAVEFVVIRCPRLDRATGRRCGSTDTRVTSTRPPIRYHRCNSCGQPFKSVEK